MNYKKIHFSNSQHYRQKLEENLPIISKSFKVIIGENIREARETFFKTTAWEASKRMQMSQIEAVTGVSTVTISAIEKGEGNFTLDSIIRVCSYFDIPINYMCVSGGFKKYHEAQTAVGTKQRKEAMKKVEKMHENAQWKVTFFFWENGIPTIQLPNGKKKTFENGTTLYISGASNLKHFAVTFYKDEQGHEMIYHDLINDIDFWAKGMKEPLKLSNEGIESPNCSSCLVMSRKENIVSKIADVRLYVPSLKQYSQGATVL
jgi:transcriptional regulator with XRE-family HTH domain